MNRYNKNQQQGENTMTTIEQYQEKILRFKQVEFKEYLQRYWEYCGKLHAARIGCHDFGLTIRQSVDVYNGIYE